MPYYPPASAAGVVSPVSTDPLTFSGAVTFSKQVVVNNAAAPSSVVGTTSGQKVLIVKGAASQSVALLDLQDSTGATVGFFDAGGRCYFGSSTSYGSVSGGPSQLNLWGDVVVQNGLLYANGSSGIKWSNSGANQTTVGAAGAASALPASPTKYLKVQDSTGATLVIPAFAAS